MVVTPQSTLEYARRESGGKGFNLYLLSRAGLPVPAWNILGRRYYNQFLKETGLESKIADLISQLAGNAISSQECEEKIAGLFDAAVLPESISTEVHHVFNATSNGGMISVRSSAADEDSSATSYAGQLSSYLYVTNAQDAEHFLKKCWASAFSNRVLNYRTMHGISNSEISVAVIFQRMIDAEKSGVMFTCDPVNQTADEFLVSGVYGVGEGLVSGQLNADNFWIGSESGKVAKSTIENKEHSFVCGESGHCTMKDIPKELQNIPCLNESELGNLHAIAKRITKLYPSPQDIEWAFYRGEFYILQSRAVTSLSKNISGYRNLWDNSNIVESYGGITLPLSFTFALHNYHMVYEQFCEILLVPRKMVREMDYYLANMLGILNGRVYYNLYNWYKLVGILPGFRHNRQFMETMMGVSEALSPEIIERIKPHSTEDTFSGKIRRMKTGFKFLYFHFAINGIVRKFLREFDENYSRVRKIDFTTRSSDELFMIFLDIRNVMMSRWKAPIINDFLCMVHFGLLKKLTQKWMKEENASIHNDLISGEGELESTQPTLELIRIAHAVSQIPELKTVFVSADPNDLMEIMSRSPHKEIYSMILNYIDRFGFRCMSEMKLEEIDLATDPKFMFVAIRNFLVNGQINEHAYEANQRRLRIEAEKKLNTSLSGYRKWIFKWVLKHARRAVRNRENTRFSRTRIYGVVRNLFQAMGKDLQSKKIIESNRDIFYLKLDEIFGIHQGTLTDYNLKAVIDHRKREYEMYKNAPSEIRFETRGAVYWNNEFLEKPVINTGAPDGSYDLKGIPCCPGVVEAKVKVISSLSDNMTLDGEILVAEFTDPGWTPLFPNASAVLVERGSLLSHSAVVAREMGIPAIVGIKGLMKIMKTGMKVRVDGKNGTIKILN